MPIKIPSIPPLLQVETLINGQLPPAIFLLVPTDHPPSGTEMKVEEFVHIDILPDDLKEKVRAEVKQRAEKFKAINEGKYPPKFQGEF